MSMLTDRLALALGVGDRAVVPVLRLSGPIGRIGLRRGGLTLAGLASSIERAFSVRGAKAVALVINSPGGSAAQSELIARRIRLLADRRNVPVLAFCEDVAASGGYWLATAADEIYVGETSIIGSIGVVAATFGFQDLIRRLGVERRVYSAGTRKTLLDPFLPEREDDVERLRTLQADIHRAFQDHVLSRRGGRLRVDAPTLFNGDIWVGRRAVELGLADGVGDLRGTVEARFGTRARLVVVNRPRRRWFGVGPSLFAGAVEDGLDALEERAIWGRFGL